MTIEDEGLPIARFSRLGVKHLTALREKCYECYGSDDCKQTIATLAIVDQCLMQLLTDSSNSM